MQMCRDVTISRESVKTRPLLVRLYSGIGWNNALLRDSALIVTLYYNSVSEIESLEE